MSIEEVKTESLVLMVAATDTSSAFLSSFVNHIIQDPEIYAKLAQEIHSFELSGKLSRPVATYEETNQMRYFMACVKETLRFSPPTPFILPRYVSKGGLNINGIWVPEGTEIGANPYIIHRDSATFGADADLFHPERWLDNDERSKEMDKSILSWGYGTRICLGKNIAQMITQKLCLQVSPIHPMPRVSDTNRRGHSSYSGTFASSRSTLRNHIAPRIWPSCYTGINGCSSKSQQRHAEVDDDDDDKVSYLGRGSS